MHPISMTSRPVRLFIAQDECGDTITITIADYSEIPLVTLAEAVEDWAFVTV